MQKLIIRLLGVLALGLIMGCTTSQASPNVAVAPTATSDPVTASIFDWAKVFPPQIFSDPNTSISKGYRLAFVQSTLDNQDIWVTNMDGSTTPISLTNSLANDYQPTWSPTATQITFVSERDNNPEIFVMNEDGSNQTRLTNNSVRDVAPVWSPDGQYIAFISNRTSQLEIFRMKIDGTEQTQITSEGVLDYGLAWSSDGQYLAYLSLSDNGALYFIQPDGTGRVKFIELVAAEIATLPADPSGRNQNCSKFETQRQAQIFYFAAGGPLTDRHELDRGSVRGLVCESLP